MTFNKIYLAKSKMNNLKIFIIKYLGWRNWSVLVYNSIIENIFIVFYIALCQDIVVSYFFTDLSFFILFSVFSTTYGYLVNDLADMELDARQGKNNTFQEDSKGKATIIVVFFAVLSILIGLHFADNALFIILWFTWLFSATFYSLKPFRLKERGKTGLIIVVLAQRVLPILLLFAAFKYYVWIEVMILTSYVLFRGLSSDLNHQLGDYYNDAGTRTQTYAVSAGMNWARKIFRVSLEIEKALLLAVLVVMYVNWHLPSVYGISLMAPVLVFYLLLYVYNLRKSLVLALEYINPFVHGRKNLFQFLHHGFPSVVLPFYLLMILIYIHWQFVVIFILLAAYRRLYSLDVVLNSYPARLLRRFMSSG